jgi:hypothetical protein
MLPISFIWLLINTITSICCINARHINILLIGDSVDRYLVTDYCRQHNASMCATTKEYAGKYNTTNCTSRGSYPISLSDLFKFSKRIFPWSIVMCDDYKHHVSIGFLFNTQGVSPQPPWFWPQKSNLDI